MDRLIQQRIRYLVERGIYPEDEPASKNFVIKWLTGLIAIEGVQMALLLYHYML